MKDTKAISLSWKGLTATTKGKNIIDNVTGYCNPGELLAIMGPSGAGKTTLLSILGKKASSDLKLSGQILANSQTFSDSFFNNFGSYVYQNDILHETLTVREVLQFASILKIKDEKMAMEKVQQLIHEFQLEKCEKAFVGGNEIKGVSGGEKKRVCIALQMISSPLLLILDEPTSGLDSNKATRVLNILKKIATKNHTVIFTIHQPSFLIYSKLDRLLLLNKGRTVYQGEAQKIGQYMQSLSIMIPINRTISDFFMTEISRLNSLGEQSPLNYENYQQKLFPNIEKEIQANLSKHIDLKFQSIYKASFLFSFLMLLQRQIKNLSRNRFRQLILLMQNLTRLLLVGVLFLHQMPTRAELNTLQSILKFSDAISLCFITVSSNIIPSLFIVALQIPKQRSIYIKQIQSKTYDYLNYYMAKIVLQAFLIILSSIVFSSVSYWLGGYTQTFQHFAFYTLAICLAAVSGNALGFFCAALFKEVTKVATLTNIIMIPLLILSGVFNKLTSMPVWVSWFQFASPFRYATHMLLLNQFGSQKFGGFYDYRDDLGINQDYSTNALLLCALTFCFYLAGFLLIKFNTDKITA